MSFKIIAVRPLQDCNEDILKNLKVNQFYFFDNNYKVDPKDLNNIIKNEEGVLIPNNFFYLPDEHNTTLKNINIQAIAGKNGDGKSSIIELFIRILNNFYKEYKIGKVTNNLLFVKEVHADLFFEKDDKIYRILVNSKEVIKRKDYYNIYVRFFENGNLIFDSSEHFEDTDRLTEFINIGCLFFTMYINYSIYALDEKDFVDETYTNPDSYYDDGSVKNNIFSPISWLSQIFHKNDGYQTPIVLHPFREEAQIDIRNEKYLMDQRLLTLIFEDDEFSVTDDLIVNKLLLKRKMDSLHYFITEFVRKYNGYNEYYKVEHLLKDNYDKRDKSEVIGKIEAYYEFLIKNSTLLKFFRKSPSNDHSEDLQKITLILFNQVLDDFQFPTNEKEFGYILKKIYSPIQNHYTISEELMEKMRYILNVTEGVNFVCFNLFQLLSIYYNFWTDHFNKDFSNDFTKELFSYCVVKSFKTIKYPKYNSLNRIDTIEYFSVNFNINKQFTEFSHQEFLERLIKDSSHISLKLRQCMKLLDIAIKDDKNELINFYSRYDNKIIEPIDISVLNSLIIDLSRRENIDKILLLPPKIFDVEIYLKSVKKDKKDISIKTLSSGEYQKISVISSIIYHLKNLDSVLPSEREESSKNKIFKFSPIYNFENVNIILDEIELYFHPEFQRQFIKEILQRINNVKFKRLISINIIFITHSPFILSDIPKSNVLFLEKGISVFPMTENTFGSNIHTLLQHGFFLNSVPMGEFSKGKINEMFYILHSGNTKDKAGNDLLMSIMLVSEPFIKSQLLKLYNDQNSEIKTLKEQINFLTNELIQIKKDNAKN